MSRSRWTLRLHRRHHQVVERRCCAGALRLHHYGFGSRCQLCLQDTHWLHFSVFLTLFTNTRLLRRSRRCLGRLLCRREWHLHPEGIARAEFFCHRRAVGRCRCVFIIAGRNLMRIYLTVSLSARMVLYRQKFLAVEPSCRHKFSENPQRLQARQHSTHEVKCILRLSWSGCTWKITSPNLLLLDD